LKGGEHPFVVCGTPGGMGELAVGIGSDVGIGAISGWIDPSLLAKAQKAALHPD